jgi:hypothetical protein
MDDKIIYIIVSGHYSTGFVTYGPFNSIDEAKAWAIEAQRIGKLEDDGWWGWDVLLPPTLDVVA